MGSEMCIRDRHGETNAGRGDGQAEHQLQHLSESSQRPSEHYRGLCCPLRRAVTQKCPPARAAGGHSCAQCFFSGVSQCWWQEAQLPPQPSPFQPPCLDTQTTASANRTASTSKVMIPRTVIIKRPLFRKNSSLSIHHLTPKSNQKAQLLQTFCKNRKLGLAFGPVQ